MTSTPTAVQMPLDTSATSTATDPDNYAAGNVQANAGLLDQASAVQPGRLPVLISITDPEWPKYQVIAGASGQAAIYTKHFHHVSVMRKVLLRMASWMNYVFPFH